MPDLYLHVNQGPELIVTNRKDMKDIERKMNRLKKEMDQLDTKNRLLKNESESIKNRQRDHPEERRVLQLRQIRFTDKRSYFISRIIAVTTEYALLRDKEVGFESKRDKCLKEEINFRAKYGKSISVRLQDLPNDLSPYCDESTLVHLVLQQIGQAEKETLKRYKPLVMYLLNMQNALLEVRDEVYGWTVLHLAAKKRFEEVVQFLCDSSPQPAPAIRQKISSDKGTCLHIAIDLDLNISEYLVRIADLDTFTTKDERGNTPLHAALAYDRFKRSPLALVKSIVERCPTARLQKNNLGLSPYQYHHEFQELQEKKPGFYPYAYHQLLLLQKLNDKRSSASKEIGAGYDPGVPSRGRLARTTSIKPEARPETPRITKEEVQSIKDFLMENCLRDMTHDEAKRYLYGSINSMLLAI